MLPARRNGRGAGVLLVIGVQDEQQIQGLGGDRIDLVGLAGHREHHVQQVAGVVQVIARIHKWLPHGMLVGGGRDGRDLGDDAMRKDLPMARVMDVHRVVIERGKGGHDGRHHAMGWALW